MNLIWKLRTFANIPVEGWSNCDTPMHMGILNIAQSEKNDQRISPSSGLHDVIVWLSERNT